MPERNNLFKVTELELTYHPSLENKTSLHVTNPETAHKVFRDNWREGTMSLVESFYALFLDNSKHVIGLAEISRGGFTATVVDPKLVFGYAIKAAASSIVLAHNHPSGMLVPSSADLVLTQRLKDGGGVLGVTVDDHLILAPNGKYISVIHEYPRPRPY